MHPALTPVTIRGFDEDGREPKRPRGWVPLLSTAEDGLSGPDVHRAHNRSRRPGEARPLEVCRLYVFNAS